jgi:hypothetical protein
MHPESSDCSLPVLSENQVGVGVNDQDDGIGVDYRFELPVVDQPVLDVVGGRMIVPLESVVWEMMLVLPGPGPRFGDDIGPGSLFVIDHEVFGCHIEGLFGGMVNNERVVTRMARINVR